MTDQTFNTYAAMSCVETILEVIYTILMPPFIRRFTKFKYFYPSISGKDLLFKQIKVFSAFVIILFPLTLNNILYSPE